jgi:hypothetical protein
MLVMMMAVRCYLNSLVIHVPNFPNHHFGVILFSQQILVAGV